MTIPCDFDRIAVEELPQAKRIAKWMKSHYPKASIIDVGCGPGLYTVEMRNLGLNACGCDSDERLVESEWLRRIDITSRQERQSDYDVALSLEVGEHIPFKDAEAYTAFLGATGATRLYFSAAPPWQTGPGHINLQPKVYWVELLHHNGFWFDPDVTDAWIGWMRQGPHMGWLVNNGMVFRR